jgi:hypothetical protein
MARKDIRCRTAFVLLLALLAPSPALAGPYLGEWGWFWKPAPDCPRSQYSPLHYWAPEYYELRACCRPTNLDQYPPGPYPPVAPSFMFTRYCCPTAPPMPTAPYADPAAYYGIQVVAPR